MARTKQKYQAVDDSLVMPSMARQSIMNGNFDVWQRGTSVTNPGSFTFLADRWLIFSSPDGATYPTTITHTRETHSPIVNKSYYFYRVTFNGAGSGYTTNSDYSLSQKIEHGTRFLTNGQTITASFLARSSVSGKRIFAQMIQGYGTGGSPSNPQFCVGNSTITLTSSWTLYTVTWTTQSLSTKTFGTNNDDYLELKLSLVNGTTFGFEGSGNVDFSQIQVNAGAVALPFQPKSYEEEHSSCLRYFQRLSDASSPLFGVGHFQTTALHYTTLHYAPKRAAPAITMSAASTFRILIPGSAIGISAMSASDQNRDRALISSSVSDTSAVIGTLQRQDGQSPYIDINAEI